MKYIREIKGKEKKKKKNILKIQTNKKIYMYIYNIVIVYENIYSISTCIRLEFDSFRRLRTS